MELKAVLRERPISRPRQPQHSNHHIPARKMLSQKNQTKKLPFKKIDVQRIPHATEAEVPEDEEEFFEWAFSNPSNNENMHYRSNSQHQHDGSSPTKALLNRAQSSIVDDNNLYDNHQSQYRNGLRAPLTSPEFNIRSRQMYYSLRRSPDPTIMNNLSSKQIERSILNEDDIIDHFSDDEAPKSRRSLSELQAPRQALMSVSASTVWDDSKVRSSSRL